MSVEISAPKGCAPTFSAGAADVPLVGAGPQNSYVSAPGMASPRTSPQNLSRMTSARPSPTPTPQLSLIPSPQVSAVPTPLLSARPAPGGRDPILAIVSAGTGMSQAKVVMARRPSTISPLGLPKATSPCATLTPAVVREASPRPPTGSAVVRANSPRVMSPSNSLAPAVVGGPPQPLPAPPPVPVSPDMVDPGSVERQRQGYAAQLVAGMRQSNQDILRQVQLDKQELAQRAALEKQTYDVMIDQFVQQQALAMDHQTNLNIMRLQHGAVAKKAELEQQAVRLKAEYEVKKAEEDMQIRRLAIDQSFQELHVPVTKAAGEVNAQRAAHGMPPCTKRPQDPIVPHLTSVPAELSNWFATYGYAAPALAVPLAQPARG